MTNNDVLWPLLEILIAKSDVRVYNHDIGIDNSLGWVTLGDSEEGRRVLVTGAGGFIGHHLVERLKRDGLWVRGVDIKEPEFEPSPADEFLLADLRRFENNARSVEDVDEVFHLAADMGGIGYITADHASLSRNNILINSHMLEASRLADIRRILFTSSACVYPSFRQDNEDVEPLREKDAIPADPERGYGWEKLFAEQLVTYYHDDFGLDTRIVRLHNVYGPVCAYDGGREKAPAAICRKVAMAEDQSSIEVWGDGKQTRSFCYVDDCVEGLLRLMAVDYLQPLNLGTSELISVDGLVDLVCDIAGKQVHKQYNPQGPEGVRGRNSDNTMLREVLGWEPESPLRDGLTETYRWIWWQLEAEGRAFPPMPDATLS